MGISIILSAFFILYSCNDSFQPLQENDSTPFAMYGYLDATADTQWVRVQPLRKYVDEPISAQDMYVTLQHVESGETAVMQDSLFTVNEGNTAINVWTTMDIEPDQTYLLRSERSDGAVSEVTVTTPPDFPTPAIATLGSPPYARGTLLLKGVDNIADILTVWSVYGETHLVNYRHRIKDIAPVGFDFSVDLSAYRDVNVIFNQDTNPTSAGIIADENVKRQVFVASGGPEWNEEITSLSDLEYAIPESFYNVENGVGYVIGIVSKTIPFESCLDDQAKPIACPEEEPFW